MLESLSLAPLKYNKFMFDKFFETVSIRAHNLLDGTDVYTANAYLKEELLPSWKDKNLLYSNCDGSGTSQYKNEAIYKAVSEGLERLAFYRNFNNSDLGFDRDCSTSGMAAFPGLFQSFARKLAYNEAIERWSLKSFWDGLTPIRKIQSGEENIYSFLTPFSKIFSVIVYRDIQIQNELRRIYGFASANKLARAIFKAKVELNRNFEVLSNMPMLKPSTEMNLMERRLLFFSETKGVLMFDAACERASELEIKPALPSVLVDSPVVGEWSPYCHIHRVLFEGMDFKGQQIEDFMF